MSLDLSTYSKIDNEIKRGDLQAAQESLQLIYKKRHRSLVPWQLASLMNRCELQELSLRLLHPRVREENLENSQATLLEKKEYGLALIKSGLSTEGRKLLMSLELQDHPDVYLPLAISFFSQWDYATGRSLLGRALKSEKITSYERYILELNLLAAQLVLNETSEFLLNSKKLEKDLSEKKHFLLLTGLYEVLAQYYIEQKEYDLAEAHIEKASSISQQERGRGDLFLKKWKWICFYFQKRDSSKAVMELNKLWAEAEGRQHWETCRDIEYWVAWMKKDLNALIRMYYRTPWENFREKVERELVEMGQEIPKMYIENLGAQEYSSTYDTFDLKTLSMLSEPSQGLRSGSKGMFLFRLLFSDAYRPTTRKEIFERIFIGEYYNPKSSGNRVKNLVYRLRQELEEKQLPFEVVQKGHGYMVLPTRPIHVKMTKENLGSDRMEQRWKDFFEAHREKDFFTREDMMRFYKMSYRNSSRFLSWAEENDFVESKNRGNGKIYFFKLDNERVQGGN